MNPVLMTLNQINDQKEYHKTCRTDLVDIFKMVFKLADSGFFKNFLYQVGVKSTVSWVFEDPKLRQLTGQSQENTNFGRNLLKF